MKKVFWRSIILAILISLTLLSGCKKVDEGPDVDVTGLTKPTIRTINPNSFIYNDTGFALYVYSDYLDNDEYALYINGQRMGTATPNYWRFKLHWNISADKLESLISTAGSGETTLTVRITSIVSDDIGDYLDKFSEYVSQPVNIKVQRNKTDFSTPVKLFSLWNNSMNPKITTDSTGSLYVAWREEVSGVTQAFFSYSQQENQWSQVLNISRSENDVDHVNMVSDGNGNFYMTWNELEENEPEKVFFSRSTDNGLTWHMPRRISHVDEGSLRPVVAVDSNGTVYAAWGVSTKNQYNDYNILYIAISSDLGKTWTYRSFTESYAMGDHVAVTTGDTGDVYFIVGGNGSVKCFYSTNSGNNWFKNKVNINQNFHNGRGLWSKMGPENKLYLYWNHQDTTGHNNENWIHFATSKNLGDSWENHQFIDDACYTVGSTAALALKGNQVNMLVEAPLSLALIRSTDDGVTWTYPEFIPGMTNPGCFNRPDMVAAADGKLYIVYIDNDGSQYDKGSIYMITGH